MGTGGFSRCFSSPPLSVSRGSGPHAGPLQSHQEAVVEPPSCLLFGVPWGFSASLRTVKVCLHLSAAFGSSFWFLRGDLKSEFAKTVVRESALAVPPSAGRPFLETAAPRRPPRSASVAPCALRARWPAGQGRVLRRSDASVSFGSWQGGRLCCVRETW